MKDRSCVYIYFFERQWKRIMDYGFQRKKVVNALKADLFSGPDELINALQQEKAAGKLRSYFSLIAQTEGKEKSKSKTV